MIPETPVPSFATLFWFAAPLAATNIALDMGEQFLNTGISRAHRDATVTLAGFGLAFQLIKLLSSPVVEMKHVGLVQVVSRQARQAAMWAIGCWIMVLLAVLALLALTPVGTLVIERLHRTSPAVSRTTHEAMSRLCWYPLLDGIAVLHAGILLRHGRHVALVSAASLADIAVQAVVVAVMLRWVQPQGALTTPLACAYGGVTARLFLCVGGYYWHVHPGLAPHAAVPTTYTEILKFVWPLALINSCQRISRPLVNLFVSRSPHGDLGVAVLTVCYPLAHVPYGWLNELKAITPAFLKTPAEVRARPDIARRIRSFALAMLAVSCSVMVVTMWTPLHKVILRRLVGVSEEIVDASSMPLFVFTFFSFPVAARAHLTGWMTAQKETERLAPSAVARLAGVLGMCLLLAALGFGGAAIGVSALLTGFVVEALTVTWLVAQFRKQQHLPAGEMPS